jgi:hypothetical protein
LSFARPTFCSSRVARKPKAWKARAALH